MKKKYLISKHGEKHKYFSRDLLEKEASVHSSLLSVNLNERDQEKDSDDINERPPWQRWKKNQVVPAIPLCIVAFAGVSQKQLLCSLESHTLLYMQNIKKSHWYNTSFRKLMILT